MLWKHIFVTIDNIKLLGNIKLQSMKIKHIISVISPLACILGWNCMTINPVNAAALNFTYTFESAETISGSFEGDLGNDNNRLRNLRNFTAVYSGKPDVTFDTLETGNFFDLDFSNFQLVGTSSSSSGDIFLAVRGDNGGGEDISVFFASTTLDADTTIALNRLDVELVDGQTTPEPGITLALAFAGSFACWQKLNKKQSPSS